MNDAHVHGDLDDYVDGGLDPARRRAVESHLQRCSECRAALATAERLARALASAPVPDPGQAYWAKFADRVESRTRGAGSQEPARRYERFLAWLVPSGRIGWVGTLGTVAALTLVLYLGLRGFRPRDMHVSTSPAPMQRELADSAAARSMQTAPAPPPAELLKGSRTAPATPVDRTQTRERPAAGLEGGASAASKRDGAPSEKPRADVEAPHETTLAASPKARFSFEPKKSKDQTAGLGGPVTSPMPLATPRVPSAAAPSPGIQETFVADESLRSAPFAAQTSPSSDLALAVARAVGRGDETTARRLCAGLESAPSDAIAPEDAETLRRWSALRPPTRDVASGKAKPVQTDKEVLPPPAPAANTAREERSFAADAGLPSTTPAAATWLALEPIVWRHRQEPGTRDLVALFARQLAGQATGDAHAAERAAALALWLAESSPTAGERAEWEALGKSLPRH